MIPSFLRPGRPAQGLDRVAGWTLRLVGVAGLGFAALAAVFAFVALTVGDVAGWGDLIRALAIMLGLGALTLAFWFVWGAHHAFRAWRAGDRAAPRRLGWGLMLVGWTAWWPIAVVSYVAPLDEMLAWLRAAMLVAGVVLLEWAR